MSLQTVVEARVSAQKLVNLTNPDLPAPTTLDSTRLAAACSDAAGEFEVYTGVEFDETDPRHIAPAIDLVVLLLEERGAAPARLLAEERERIVGRLKDLGLVTGRNRVIPVSTPEDRGTFPEQAFDETTIDPQAEDADDWDDDD